MVTQDDIAKRLNISRTTVARALSGKLVSDETRRMVLEEVKKLGYIPNSAATSLALKNEKIVYAFIAATIDEGYGQHMKEGILTAAQIWQGYNYRVEVVFTDITRDGDQCKTQREQLDEVLSAQQVDGVIWGALSAENMDYASLRCREKQIPLMTLDMIYKNNTLCHVGPDYFKLGTYSAAYIAQLIMGRGRILTMSYDEGYEIGQKRMEGFWHKLKDYPAIEYKNCVLETMSQKCYDDALNEHFHSFSPIAIYAPYHADFIGNYLNRIHMQHKIITISNGVNEQVETYLFNGTINGIVSARPYYLGAVISSNFFKYFYRPNEMLTGDIDVAVDIYLKETYDRYDQIF